MQTKLPKTLDLSQFLSNSEFASKISVPEIPFAETVKENKTKLFGLSEETLADLDKAEGFEHEWQKLNHR